MKSTNLDMLKKGYRRGGGYAIFFSEIDSNFSEHRKRMFVQQHRLLNFNENYHSTSRELAFENTKYGT